jgi:5-formyltetrahydrofolate cyclo-ligase
MPTSEVYTLPIIAHALANGKRVFVPYIPKGGAMSMVRVYDGEDLASNRDGWGIPVVGLDREDGSKREDGELDFPSLRASQAQHRPLVSRSQFAPRRIATTGPHYMPR